MVDSVSGVQFTGDETKESVAKDLPTLGVKDKDAQKF